MEALEARLAAAGMISGTDDALGAGCGWLSGAGLLSGDGSSADSTVGSDSALSSGWLEEASASSGTGVDSGVSEEL